jgi:hemerythrin-like domain-containing protein
VKQVQDPFEVLTQERSDEGRYISQLERAAESIKMYGFSADAFSQITDAVVYIDTVLRRHDQVEERHLFPLLEPYASESVNEMKENWRQLWNAFNRLRYIVSDIENSKVDGNSIPDLVDAAKYLAKLMNIHLADEDGVLFPLSRKKLTPKEYAKLAVDLANSTEYHSG